ncbi:hypothetical protein AMV073 [Betaentomopoxvirus amoorei]|uniref:AMV073 n=1 Tax=Amsacta moorei entomopoxvirus TaxID=28321 RepID=Q9EMX6_AMEPV|nr:hypothetical protein AMV073 [Amsacta moorei entomopoxvirus]AAG02779.1 AMV073 [Amsacta moorei entomopoxvirus]
MDNLVKWPTFYNNPYILLNSQYVAQRYNDSKNKISKDDIMRWINDSNNIKAHFDIEIYTEHNETFKIYNTIVKLTDLHSKDCDI